MPRFGATYGAMSCAGEPGELSTGRVFCGNIMNRFWAHEILPAPWLHNLFFKTQTIKQHQNFKQSLGIFVFQICRASAARYNQTQECIKLPLPFDRKPAFKHRDDLAGSNLLKRRAKLPWLATFNRGQLAVNFVSAEFFGKNRQNPIYYGETLGVILCLRFSHEIMNPEITIAFQRTPCLFRDMLEKKNVMERCLRGDQIECFLG